MASTAYEQTERLNPATGQPERVVEKTERLTPPTKTA
jgi:hypothetical protein